MARSIPTNHTFGLKTGSVFFAVDALSLHACGCIGASRTDLSQLANGIWEIHAGCPSFLCVSSVAKIGYIPQFKASNARDQDEVSSDLARMAVDGLDIAIMSVHSRFASRFVSCAQNFGSVL